MDTDHPVRPFRLLLCWLGTVIGCAGLGAAFLHGLSTVSVAFNNHGWLLYSLPLLGLASVWIYRHWATAADGGMRRVRDAVEGGQTLAPSTAPAIVATTLLSHLGGASVGREGTAVQMGAGIADLCVGWAKPGPGARRMLLLCGIAAGFSAVFGTPLAGAVFALEFMRRASWAFIPCLAASWGADFIARRAFFSPHTDYRLPFGPDLGAETFLWAAVIGVAAAVGATAYLLVLRLRSRIETAFPSPYLRVAVGGVFVAVLLFPEGGRNFSGLGLQLIDASFLTALPAPVFILKLIITAACVLFGFRGGEVTPLLAAGAALGSAMGAWIGLPVVQCAALGMVALFAGAGKVPLTCIALAAELFHPGMALPAALACATSALLTRSQGLYFRPARGASE
ncbi:MAG: chloride channel protein [Verrucomicrobiota bacterium]